MSVNSLGIKYSAITARYTAGLERHARRLVETDLSHSVLLAVKAPPEMTLGALSIIPDLSANKILQALPEAYLGRLFSLDNIWPSDAAARVLKNNYISSSISGILSVAGMSAERRAALIKCLAFSDQFNVIYLMSRHAAVSAISSDVLTPAEIMLIYNTNLPQLGSLFPGIKAEKAKAILEAMRNEELIDFISGGFAQPGQVAYILGRRKPEEIHFTILDKMPDTNAAKVLEDPRFPMSSAAGYAKRRLLSRGSLFPFINPSRLQEIFRAMDDLPA